MYWSEEYNKGCDFDCTCRFIVLSKLCVCVYPFEFKCVCVDVLDETESKRGTKTVQKQESLLQQYGNILLQTHMLHSCMNIS